MISEGIGWTHRLAIDQTQRRFHDLVGQTRAGHFDVDASCTALCEGFLWACIADEGLNLGVGPKKSSRREALAEIRRTSGRRYLAW